MVAVLRSLGAPLSVAPVFVSFMISSLFRTVSVIPGSLGTFEASAVFTLKLVGVPVAAGLSATLLFRGLSLWLPTIPGWWCSRRVLASVATDAPGPPAAYWSLRVDALYRHSPNWINAPVFDFVLRLAGAEPLGKVAPELVPAPAPWPREEPWTARRPCQLP
jgi:hypothetical protein